MKTAEERFWEKVERVADCLMWTGSKNTKGYGLFLPDARAHNGSRPKSVLVHRWFYKRVKGPIPPGLCLDHLCRNRACVNPEHLEVVTNKVNILRGVGAPAKNAVKTHCMRGHEFTGANTYSNGVGWRKCRTCQREHNREHYHRHLAAGREVGAA